MGGGLPTDSSYHFFVEADEARVRKCTDKTGRVVHGLDRIAPGEAGEDGTFLSRRGEIRRGEKKERREKERRRVQGQRRLPGCCQHDLPMQRIDCSCMLPILLPILLPGKKVELQDDACTTSVVGCTHMHLCLCLYLKAGG